MATDLAVIVRPVILSLEKGMGGETGRIELQKALAEYAEGISEGQIENPEKELGMVNRFIALLESDGIAGRELSTL